MMSIVSPEAAAFLEKCRPMRAITEIAASATEHGWNTAPFGEEIADHNYTHPAVDVIAPGTRLFFHSTFPRGVQEEGDTLLTDGGFSILPMLTRSDAITARLVHGEVSKLLPSVISKKAAQRISKTFLAPTLWSLYQKTSMVPDRNVLNNLLGLTRIDSRFGRDDVTSEVVFVPPYNFHTVEPAEFVDAARDSTHTFGPIVRDLLTDQLQDLFSARP